MNKRLLVVCGSTATGKTDLALKLAKKFNGQIISADSRQVFKGFDIGTGKDLPNDAKQRSKNLLLKYYQVKGVALWGYDLVNPNKEYSVGHYIKYATRVVKLIWKSGQLPILVGGTGLYIKGVVDGIDTANIPRSNTIRSIYALKNASELFDILAQLDAPKAASLNFSDKKNPRRLIRAIEIATLSRRKKIKKLVFDDLFMIGLTTDKEELEKRIGKRVDTRMQLGFLKEVELLLAKKVKLTSQAMQALGYKQAIDLITGKIDNKTFTESWTQSEINYSKKQNTWFSKDKRIKWIDVAKNDYEKQATELVKEWINKST